MDKHIVDGQGYRLTLKKEILLLQVKNDVVINEDFSAKVERSMSRLPLVKETKVLIAIAGSYVLKPALREKFLGASNVKAIAICNTDKTWNAVNSFRMRCTTGSNRIQFFQTIVAGRRWLQSA